MDSGLFRGAAARHRTEAHLVNALIHVVVTVHRHLFSFCDRVMVGSDGAVIATAAGAASYRQANHERTLQ